ncbi:MAG: phosphotransferase [bacterium]|nr:phosphotransferase [bacterium]
MTNTRQKLIKLFKDWANEEVVDFQPLVQSGSDRKYFRISGKQKSAIGVFNPEKKENKAFITFTKHFLKRGLNVPKLYSQQLNENVYLLEDLGDTTLFSIVEKEISQGGISKKTIDYYKDSLTHLLKFQIDGNKGLDYSVCYPRNRFDKQSIIWDLNYFKYYFLKLAKIPFDEQKLEDDFHAFSKFLLSADAKYFMYRDFQSRNILICNDQLYFIDYQGGKKGALQYDVASLLFQAKVNLSPQIRDELLQYYLVQAGQKSHPKADQPPAEKVKSQSFLKYYYGFVLIRLMQTLGAYGFRGYYENKSHFLSSIPFALKNLQWLSEKNHIPKYLPELTKVVDSILVNEELKNLNLKASSNRLKVTINSFSYKNGIPKDFSGNGGGFVFDCRSLENPGRYPEYVNNTGQDENVINFLKNKSNVKNFLESVYSIVDAAVNNYSERGFKNLMINFGCTGGQHRSVYCAENLAKHITKNFKVDVSLNHTQINKKGNL